MKNTALNDPLKSENSTAEAPVTTPAAFDLPPIEPWEQPVDGAALLDELAALLRRFVVLPAWAPEALTLWVLHTYAFHLREVSAYIGIESPEKRCGKSTLLAVLGLLVHRPVIAANISPPALFRVIGEFRPTLLIDEADTFFARNDELRGILNAGYSRATAFVVRVASASTGLAPCDNSSPSDKGAARRRYPTGLASFSCWCPKAMAAIGHLPETLADRCIVVRMRRKRPGEPCERLRQLDATELRRQCARFIQDHAPRIAAARPLTPPDLNDRAADIWEPLLVLAELAGGAWPARARETASALSADAPIKSPMGALLVDIRHVFAQAQAQFLSSRDLIGGLNGLGERAWAPLLAGRPLTERWLALKLRPLGVRPFRRLRARAQSRGYARQPFEQLAQKEG